ncbi:acyltransferase [Alloacidobacterium dinghuense]|uniref:Acyltransferase n=1 Tax=Alloacidobacterium dinghuense TaxID=2763107 RepID=A0A7G8BIM7_9BACT|nr:acyltransferase [Alloacidobacterium dinghuense]QNI32397.1 acyltransferase [Alloacidobacterium dinghuense]
MDDTALSQPARRGFYRPELDALRFFAFLCIFFLHTLSRANIGAIAGRIDLRDVLTDSLKFAVSLFFLLSGYLITALLAMEKESAGHVHLAAFYRRRIARIWPLYYSFILAVLLAGTVVSKLRPSGWALAAFTFLSGNWFLSRIGGMTGGLGILWSVNIEEQFYLLWPLLIQLGRGRSWKLSSAGILACSYLILLGFGLTGRYSDLTLRFNTLVEMQYFAGGALLAATLPRDGLDIPLILRPLIALSGLCCWAAGVRLFSRFYGAGMQTVPAWWGPSALYGCVLAGCVLLFLSFYGMSPRWLPRPLLWLGKISYGLYVYHSLILALLPGFPSGRGYLVARLAVALLSTILIAGISYRWLEKPFLRWRERFTFVPNRPV